MESSASIIIRPMQLADAPLVSKIDKACFSLPWPENAFVHEVQAIDHSIPLVAVKQDEQNSEEIVGFIVVWFIIDEAHIGTLAVDGAYRQMGIAEKLMDEGLRLTKNMGALKAFLEVRSGNEAAKKLYEKLGFTVDGIRPHYYQDNHEDALLMSMEMV